MEFLLAIAASLAAAGISGGAGYLYGKVRGREEFEQEVEARALQFVERLGTRIAAADLRRGHEIAEARGIVDTRNAFREALNSLGEALNSTIDQLEREIAEGNIDAVRETLMVLSRSWPERRHAVESRIRVLIAELGFRSK